MPTGCPCAWKLPARFAQEAIEPILGCIRFSSKGFRLPYIYICATLCFLQACTYTHTDRQADNFQCVLRSADLCEAVGIYLMSESSAFRTQLRMLPYVGRRVVVLED